MLYEKNIVNDVVFIQSGFRVVLSEAKGVLRKPIQSVFSIRKLLEHRYESGFRVVLSEAKDVSRKPLLQSFSYSKIFWTKVLELWWKIFSLCPDLKVRAINEL